MIRFVKLEVKLYRGVGRPKDQAKKQVRLRTTIFFNTYRIEVINIDFEARTVKSFKRSNRFFFLFRARKYLNATLKEREENKREININ